MEMLCDGAQCINKRDSPRHGAIAPVLGCYSIFFSDYCAVERVLIYLSTGRNAYLSVVS